MVLIYKCKMKTVKIKDKEFELFLSQEEIEKAIDKVAAKMNEDLADADPLFICILNGAFMFVSDLMKRVNVPSEMTFVKLSSYSGTSSTGKIREIFGLVEDIKGRTVVIIEDIVDTGHTMSKMLDELKNREPKDIKVATLLFKPKALQTDVKLDYVALEIPSDFIVGYGLDYDGYGRNLSDIYKVID